jgi:hypothetical protein
MPNPMRALMPRRRLAPAPGQPDPNPSPTTGTALSAALAGLIVAFAWTTLHRFAITDYDMVLMMAFPVLSAFFGMYVHGTVPSDAPPAFPPSEPGPRPTPHGPVPAPGTQR